MVHYDIEREQRAGAEILLSEKTDIREMGVIEEGGLSMQSLGLRKEG